MITINKSGGRIFNPVPLTITIGGLVGVSLYFSYFRTYPKITSSKSEINYLNISTSTSLSNEIVDHKLSRLPLEIYAKNNLTDYSKHFIISKDTTVLVNAVGEAADYSSNPSLFRPWDNDGIEFYFNVNDKKTNAFDLNKGDRQYRILWKTNQVDGQNINKSDVRILEKDPSSTYYIMEVTFPWKSLGLQNPEMRTKLCFDATVIDSDGGSEKAKIDWHSNIDEDWKSSINYGSLVLGDNNMPKTDSIVLAVRRIHENYVNKKATTFSSLTPLYKYKNITVGYVTDSLDLSGKFRAEWDSDNLYLQVCVRDNIKSVAKALFDYGWIEDNRGKMIWQMNMNNMKYAGGALKNKRSDTVLFLKKGDYYLKYHTDESHSPSKWDDVPPNTNFYGIRLRYNK